VEWEGYLCKTFPYRNISVWVLDRLESKEERRERKTRKKREDYRKRK